MKHRSLLQAAASAVIENGRLCLVLGGAGWLYIGIAGWSRPAANVVAGLMLMTLGMFPYVMAMTRRPDGR